MSAPKFGALILSAAVGVVTNSESQAERSCRSEDGNGGESDEFHNTNNNKKGCRSETFFL